ncbi:hypothetical protein [Desulfovibrio litoralis]|uniref:Uncharacterized protein n=1 Tax=Desulfovibrio litoralis DSM 11393 TaxID=1121455 RepID=A0A1M7TPS0_9BACT|nr:hypothetical protein [Desulfovibrio litoralis]SHN72737.1 hypothetical protein SAMN02745728_02345 [Desulfovibrio litoralis DSM 11393]
MNRLLILLVGCAIGYVVGGYVDGVTGDNEKPETTLPEEVKPEPF